MQTFEWIFVLVFLAGLVYAEDEKKEAAADLRVVETVLLYQRSSGGWPKNYDRQQRLTVAEQAEVLAEKDKHDSTIDNGATYTEVRLLTDAYHSTVDDRFRQAVLRGIAYLLDAQYDNGGWPQYFPPRRNGYSRHITFNDNAMIGVMSLLRDVTNDKIQFSFVPRTTRYQCQQAFERGIDCILKCQIVIKGILTVWCAQHDEVTFEPRPARSYELASLSGSESVGIVHLLMQVDQPNDAIVHAIESAAAWFEQSKLMGLKLVRIEDPSQPTGFDKVVIKDPNASPMWARFYDMETGQPIFCSRDGIPRQTLVEISHERRNGYSWLGHYARQLLDRDFPAWLSRMEKKRDHKDVR